MRAWKFSAWYIPVLSDMLELVTAVETENQESSYFWSSSCWLTKSKYSSLTQYYAMLFTFCLFFKHQKENWKCAVKK